MKLSTLRWLTFFFSAVSRIHAASILPNVDCNKPVETTVAVDAPQHRFYPYYVKLHRCQGSVHRISPNVKKCVPITQKEIKIRVFKTWPWKEIEHTVYNHTKCGQECKTDKTSPAKCDYRVQEWNEDTCECKCLFRDRPPPENVVARKSGFRWNKRSCRYECNKAPDVCPVKKEWDGKKCSCVCRGIFKSMCDGKNKPMDSETCECKDKHLEVHGKRPEFFSYYEAHVLVAVLVVAGIVIFALTGILIYCWRTRPHTTKPSQLEELETSVTDTATIDTVSECPSRVNYVSGV